MRGVGGFRVLAVAYGLGVVLIAPQWLAADGVPVRTPLVKLPAAEVPATPTPAPAVPSVPSVPSVPAAAQPVQTSAPKPAAPAAPQPAPVEEQQPSEAPAPAAPAARAEPAAPPTDGAIVVAQEDPDDASGGAVDASGDDSADATLAQNDGAKKKKKTDERGDEPVASTAASQTVRITDFKFTPSTVTVNVGDTVTWVNDGPTLHTATAEDGSFDTGNLDDGESGSATFNTPGTISYICTPHPFMKGKVVVRAAANDDTDTGGATNGEAPSDTSPAAADTAEVDRGSTAGLAATGTETALIALLGLLTLGVGVLLRRRERAHWHI